MGGNNKLHPCSSISMQIQLRLKHKDKVSSVFKEKIRNQSNLILQQFATDDVNTTKTGKYGSAYQLLNGYYHLTAYFTSPNKVCDNTTQQYSDIVGDQLVFFRGKDEYVNAPKESKNAAGTKWVKGKCFVSMGEYTERSLAVSYSNVLPQSCGKIATEVDAENFFSHTYDPGNSQHRLYVLYAD